MWRVSTNVAALGINCIARRFIPSLIAEATSASNKPVIVYPNSGKSYDAGHKVWSEMTEPGDFAAASTSWQQSGACLIGGCCRTTPRHLEEMQARRLY